MQIKLFLLSFLVITIACNQSQTKSSKQDTQIDNPSQTNNLTEQQTENHPSTKLTEELIQGKWQHIDDTSNYLVFEDNYRKEIAGGMSGWDEEEYTISDGCLNESDKANGLEKEEDKYLSCKKSDLCWYIIEVDEENLMLSYMGRGNTLTYKRVK
jgi:hypothetical protein